MTHRSLRLFASAEALEYTRAVPLIGSDDGIVMPMTSFGSAALPALGSLFGAQCETGAGPFRTATWWLSVCRSRLQRSLRLGSYRTCRPDKKVPPATLITDHRLHRADELIGQCFQQTAGAGPVADERPRDPEIAISRSSFRRKTCLPRAGSYSPASSGPDAGKRYASCVCWSGAALQSPFSPARTLINLLCSLSASGLSGRKNLLPLDRVPSGGRVLSG
jgi:hypothetical protein